MAPRYNGTRHYTWLFPPSNSSAHKGNGKMPQVTSISKFTNEICPRVGTIFWQNTHFLKPTPTGPRQQSLQTGFIIRVWQYVPKKNKSQQTLRQYDWLLTHWGQDKMADISQMTFSNKFSWMKMCKFLLRFYWKKFVPRGPINNIPALVQIMAWYVISEIRLWCSNFMITYLSFIYF